MPFRKRAHTPLPVVVQGRVNCWPPSEDLLSFLLLGPLPDMGAPLRKSEVQLGNSCSRSLAAFFSILFPLGDVNFRLKLLQTHLAWTLFCGRDLEFSLTVRSHF